MLYYSGHCPWNAKYIPFLEKAANERGARFTTVKLQSAGEARQVPNPFPTYAMFCDGKFVTNEMFSDKKFIKFLEEKGGGA